MLEVVSGENIAYLGKNYRIKIVENQSTPLSFDGQWFYFREQDRLDAPEHFQAWYQNIGGKWLHERVHYWEPKFVCSTEKIIVRDLGFRWGSCGKTGTLYFNWRLLQLPVFIIDYVIAHELTHLHEHNHTREFWRILDRVLPDWKERKEELSHIRAEIVWCVDSGDQRERTRK